MERLRPVLVGLLLDIIDFIGGFIPLLGDLIDVVGVAYFWFVEKMGPTAVAGAVEVVPALDFLPTFTALGVYKAWRLGG